MAKKRKSKKMEKKLLYYFLEQQRHNNLGLTTMDSEVMPGLVHHVKAAHQAEAQQASDDSEQLKWLLMCFKEQQHCIGELEEELVRANKKNMVSNTVVHLVHDPLAHCCNHSTAYDDT